jgi:hypothetical protein
MRAVLLAMALLSAGTGAARASCADETKEFKERVERQYKLKPTPQSAAAAKELQKLDRPYQVDEVECYNTLARARRALAAPPPPAREAKP